MTDKKVLITSRSFGKISAEPADLLKNAGFELTFIGDDFRGEDFARRAADYDALILGAQEFKAEDMRRCHKLKIICKHGVGLDNIDLACAREMGITVTNTPGTNSGAVADLTFGLLLACARKIIAVSNDVRAGRWKPVVGSDVCNKTLGLLGFGAISRLVAKRAAGFDMRVLAYDPYLRELPEGFGRTDLAGMDEVIRNCDFLSLHLPLTPETAGMISEKELASMKKGAYIINTARGGIIDEDALYRAIRSGHIAGAALDVLAKEPVSGDNPLLELENVIITPHIGASSKEALAAMGMICARNIAAKFTGGEIKFVVE